MTRKKKGATASRHGRKAAPVGRKRRKDSVQQILADVRQIVREVAELPTLHEADPDSWLYDDRGLPH
ncbi:MAG: hypothetical protein JO083_07320 [Candidatus Eremiobacteraeota bacterium]|nr:hypothetical protein [Candidatus Eremiobacteraeota bacterium]